MGEGSSGSNTADSYIGSLISLTSKSEIRYEGILYTVDTENSNIALQNVRSYGTEGRKKDGPQILAGDKVYDYIIFRGSDIKDLQVKSSPAVQSPAQPPSDPAIISLQSQYTQSTASIPPAYVPAPVGPLVDGSPSSTYSAVPGSSYRGGVHSLYQAAGTIGSWGLPPPGSSGTGLAVPLYWQGYYRPSAGQTHIHHQQLPQPPPSLPAPPHLLQLTSRSYPSSEVSPGPGGTAIDLQASEPYATSLPAPILSAPISTGSFASSQVPSMLTPVSPTVASGSPAQVVEGLADTEAASGTFLAINMAPNAVHGVSAVITPAAKIPRRVVVPLQHTQTQSLSSASTSKLIPPPSPALSTVNIVSLPRSQSDVELSSAFPIAHVKTLANSRLQKLDRKVSDVATSGPHPFNRSIGEKEHQQCSQPLLPLPVPAVQAKHIIQGNSLGMCNNYARRCRPRGSGKGVVLLHATQHFTEDFDFMAMNKKFNKDEVWGELGGKGEYKERVVEAEEGGAHNCDNPAEVLSESLVSELQKKAVYVKDDFFDSLSCDALDREGGRAERTKFSEQRKIDTETFGTFPLRSRAGRGRGVGRRGGYRGVYYSPQYATGGRSTPHVRARGTV